MALVGDIFGTYPLFKVKFESMIDDFPFSRLVGYVSSLEGMK